MFLKVQEGKGMNLNVFYYVTSSRCNCSYNSNSSKLILLQSIGSKQMLNLLQMENKLKFYNNKISINHYQIVMIYNLIALNRVQLTVLYSNCNQAMKTCCNLQLSLLKIQMSLQQVWTTSPWVVHHLKLVVYACNKSRLNNKYLYIINNRQNSTQLNNNSSIKYSNNNYNSNSTASKSQQRHTAYYNNT